MSIAVGIRNSTTVDLCTAGKTSGSTQKGTMNTSSRKQGGSLGSLDHLANLLAAEVVPPLPGQILPLHLTKSKRKAVSAQWTGRKCCLNE